MQLDFLILRPILKSFSIFIRAGNFIFRGNKGGARISGMATISIFISLTLVLGVLFLLLSWPITLQSKLTLLTSLM